MPLALPRYRRGQPAAHVDRSLRQAMAAYDEARQCALLWFHDVLTRGLYRDLGYASMEQYATEGLGFSRNRMWQFLRLARELDRLPPLREAVEAGKLEWTKAQQVSRAATPATAKVWVEKAEKSSRRELAREIKAARTAAKNQPRGQGSLDLAGPREKAAPPAPRTTVRLILDNLEAARLDAMIEVAKKAGRLPVEATREEAIMAALESLATAPDLRRRKSATPYRVVLYRCRECEKTEVVAASGRRPVSAGAAAAALENAVVHDGGRNRNAIPPAVRQEVLARDGHRCRAPGCRSARFLEIHHILPRARGGTHRPANLITLCSRCHRLLHERPRAARGLIAPVDGLIAPVDGLIAPVDGLIAPVDGLADSPFNESEPGGLP